MQLFLAESCGRWGCTLWEGLLTLLLMALFKTGPVAIIFILALPLLVVGSVILGIVWIYEQFVSLVSPQKESENKESETHVEAKSVELRVSTIKQIIKVRQYSKNNDGLSKAQEPKISSVAKPLGAIFNRALQSIDKNKASQ